MGRIAAHSEEEVFKAADALAAQGREVTPTTLREVLGRGSFSTLGKHVEAWEKMRKTAPPPVILEMPDAVKVALAQCWQAAAAEAGKEIVSIREKTDAELKGMKRRLDEALSEIERLETEANADATRLETIEGELTAIKTVTAQAATDAAAREAALSATAEQMRRQIDAQQDELARVHKEAEAARSQHSAEIARLTGDFSRQLAEQATALQTAHGETDHLRSQLTEIGEKLDAASVRERAKIEEAATAKAETARLADALKSAQTEAARLTDQIKEQKLRSTEVIGQLEKQKQTLDADLTATRKEARETAAKCARAQGELETLRTQVASQSDTIRRLTDHGDKKGKGGQS